LAKKKTAKKVDRGIARIAPTAAKAKLMMTRVRDLEGKLTRSVPRAQLQSAMAKYRMAVARFNSEHHRVKLLQTRVCSLECRIKELERDLTVKSA